MKSYWRQPIEGEWVYATSEDQKNLADFMRLPYSVDDQDWEVQVSEATNPDELRRAFEHFQAPGIRASLGWLLIAVAEDLLRLGEGESAKGLLEDYSPIAESEPATHAYAVWYWTGGQFPVERFGVSEFLMPLRQTIQNELTRLRPTEVFELVVDGSSLSNPKGRPQIGLCEMRFGGESFPHPGWDDFVIVVLGWWLRETSSMLGPGPLSSGTLLFMDGPYEVRLSLTDGSLARYEAIKRRRDDRCTVSISGRVDLKQVVEELSRAADELVRKMTDIRGDDSDLAVLEAAVYAARNW